MPAAQGERNLNIEGMVWRIYKNQKAAAVANTEKHQKCCKLDKKQWFEYKLVVKNIKTITTAIAGLLPKKC